MKKQGLLVEAVFIGITTFCLYTLMYAIRKPFSALTYNNILVWGVNVKIWMVLAQLLGYTLSKFIGIKILGGIKNKDRSTYLIGILSIATIPLFLIQYSNAAWWPLLMLLNGFPLGLVWGIIFSFVEGRKFTELIGAILACTFIFSSGWVKSFGLYLQNIFHLNSIQIPFTTAFIALIIAAFVIKLLEKLPPPSEEDKLLRNAREPLNAGEQKSFLRDNGKILFPFVIIYGIFTIMRDFRDNFTAEILTENGAFSDQIFTHMELKVTLVLLCLVPLFSLIKNHRSALNTTVFSIIMGLLAAVCSTILFANKQISIETMLMITGGGFYLGYILINISVMDRIIGFSGKIAHSGFLMYIADSVGYLFSLTISSVALLNKLDAASWTTLYSEIIFWGSIIILPFACGIPFQLQKKKNPLHHAEIITT